MQVACQNCGTEHVLKDVDLGRHDQVQFRCSKCGQNTVVNLQRNVNSTMVISPLPSFARSDATSSNVKLPPLDDGARLPANASVVLSITSGPAQGTSHTLKKARVIVGRAGADIPLEDPEISRQHCLLEVRETYINLKDLDSTNGTFYEDERVRAAMLLDGAEFRIGESLIRVNFLKK
jgi:Inner membrane component of T3SS, cytoplasmic domain